MGRGKRVSGAVMGTPCLHSMQRKRSVGQRPVPGVGRPKPQPRVHGPRCRALYQYIGQDVDELSFNVNEVIEILMEGVCTGSEVGVWSGQNPDTARLPPIFAHPSHSRKNRSH